MCQVDLIEMKEMRIAITRPHSSHSTTRGSRQTTGIFYRLDVGMTLNLIV